MSDPLSVVGSVVGIVSLGITVAQGLIDYYQAFQGQAGDSAHTTKKLSRLLDLLESMRQQIARRQFRVEDDAVLANMRSSMEDCKALIEELDEQLKKFHQTPTQDTFSGLRVTARRLAYPFRQSTLQKLDEDVDEFISCLTLAMQIVQQGDIVRVQDEISDIKELLDLVRASQVSSSIRDWLKAPDATIGLNEAVKKKHPGTGSWFVKGADFSSWLEKPRSFLWLVGFAGCGKSVLCSTAIQHTFRHRRADKSIGIAFFFFTFNDESKQDASAMLRALILQLSSQLNDGDAFLSSLHDSYRNSCPPNQALETCLLQLVRAFKDVYIFLDALDESPKAKHRETLLEVLAELRRWAEPGLHIMVSSRDEVEIRDELSPEADETIKMKNEAIDSDIASFIAQHLRSSRRLRKWEEHHPRIEDELTRRAQGVFRWVECQFKALAGCPQSEDLLERLLNGLPETLEDTYERMLGNIASTSRDYARRMLMLLCCAKRPLTVAELTDGIAVEFDGTPRFNWKRKLKNIDALQEVCPGFTELDVDPDTQDITVRIAHFSVREYLESERIRSSKDGAFFSVRQGYADMDMASICLVIVFETGLEVSELPSSEHHQRKNDLALNPYAARYWPDHFSNGIRNPQTDTQVLQLFTRGEVFNRWVKTWDCDRYDGKAPQEIPFPLYYAASLGLGFGVSEILDKGADINAPGGRYKGTALQAASARGRNTTVQLLLDRGADVNALGGSYRTALIAASAGGHNTIVQLLLDRGADINALGESYRTALQEASAWGRNTTVQLLLDRGADVNAPGGRHTGTALQEASAEGRNTTIQLLLDRGADINAPGGRYKGTALQAASARGRNAIIQLLLDKGADVNAPGWEYTGTALQEASAGGHNAIIQLLLDKGADINAEGGSYGTALQAASRNGHNTTIKLLLENGAGTKVDVRNKEASL